jgi:hypothetical protein
MPAIAYTQYIYTGSRGVNVSTKKRDKVVSYTLRKGIVFNLKPATAGPKWVSLTIDKLGPTYVFTIPVNTMRRLLSQAKLNNPTKQAAKSVPMHLVQVEQAWRSAKPTGLGKLPVQPFYIVAKWANIHKGVNVSPADLFQACDYIDKGMPKEKKAFLKDMKPYVMSVHRGMKTMKALFNARMSRTVLLQLADFIQNPRKLPSPAVRKLISAHDKRWKVAKTGNGYVR